MGLELGDIIDDKYRIVRLLGEGGMGAVYEGENTRIHRRVAIKVLHSNVANSDDAVQRFEREAQAAGRIGSEHIVEVLDLGDLPSGDRYMVMEYLEGESLNDRIAGKGRLSPQATASIVIDTLTGLRAAHEAGIIHRDLKPDNLFLLSDRGGKKDFVKIVDFGISKFSAMGGEFSMTRTGAVMGTPFYLSPEQAKGDRNLDKRADLYAVGVILYEAVAGKVPFDGETFNELLFKIVLEPIPSLSSIVPDIDPHFAAIVEKSMARDPGQRFQSAEEMILALRAWLAGQPLAPELAEQAAAARMGSTQIDHRHGGGTVSGARTHGAWANTNTEAPAPTQKQHKWSLIAAAAVVLLGGGGFMVYQSLQEKAAATQAAAVQAEAELAQKEAERKRDEELARLAAEKAQAEEERAEANRARSEAEAEVEQVRMSAAEAQRKREQDAKLKAEEEAKRKARATAAANRRRAENPAPSPTPAKSGGRTIRTNL